MENYGAMIRNVFEMGSIQDANMLFEACIRSAFPTNTFRRLELIRFLKDEQYMEGRSWNHVFEIKACKLNNSPVWEVSCRRVTMGTAPEKHVFLDYTSLGFVQYKEPQE